MDAQTPVPATLTRRVWTRIVATVLFFAAFEGLLFHTGLYSSIVEPNSSTGFMELQLRNEIRRLELFVKKLQSELDAQRQYCTALEAHCKTLQDAE